MTVASESATGADYIRQGFRALLDIDDSGADLLENLIAEAWARSGNTVSTDSGNLISTGEDGKPLLTGISYEYVEGIDSPEAGALYQAAIIDHLDVEAVQFGTAAFIDAVPSGAFPTATQSSGSITLDFTGKTHLKTTTTAAITTIDFNGSIPDGTEVTWILVHTTARDVTFPAGTWIADNSGSLTFSGTASSRTELRIVNDGGTLYVYPGKPAVAAS